MKILIATSGGGGVVLVAAVALLADGHGGGGGAVEPVLLTAIGVTVIIAVAFVAAVVWRIRHPQALVRVGAPQLTAAASPSPVYHFHGETHLHLGAAADVPALAPPAASVLVRAQEDSQRGHALDDVR